MSHDKDSMASTSEELSKTQTYTPVPGWRQRKRHDYWFAVIGLLILLAAVMTLVLLLAQLLIEGLPLSLIHI